METRRTADFHMPIKFGPNILRIQMLLTAAAAKFMNELSVTFLMSRKCFMKVPERRPSPVDCRSRAPRQISANLRIRRG
jgi:hypothetical protein